MLWRYCFVFLGGTGFVKIFRLRFWPVVPSSLFSSSLYGWVGVELHVEWVKFE